MGAYQKNFTRDFCLGLIEIWCGAEGLDGREWASGKPDSPYIVFQRKEDAVICYLDEKGKDWLKKQVEKHLGKGILKEVKEGFLERFKKLEDTVNEERVLDMKKLEYFTKALRDIWTWFDGMWWTIEVLEEKGKDFSDILALRKRGENLIPGSDAVIRKSIKKEYPDYERFVDVIRLSEAFTGNFPKENILEQRLKGYFCVSGNLYVGKSKKYIEKEYGIKFEKEKPTDELKGQTAYPGKAKGRVRKVLGRKDVPKLKNGEILVAASTTPDFMPAIKKCSAIVGDEGGMLTHTSIAAREMEKPCVIGTKNATRVLKDGDEVEVDADEGVVKKL